MVAYNIGIFIHHKLIAEKKIFNADFVKLLITNKLIVYKFI